MVKQDSGSKDSVDQSESSEYHLNGVLTKNKLNWNVTGNSNENRNVIVE